MPSHADASVDACDRLFGFCQPEIMQFDLVAYGDRSLEDADNVFPLSVLSED